MDMLRDQIEPIIDVYHGVSVVDPCRWLEDSDSLLVKKWTERQSAIYDSYMSKLPILSSIRSRIRQMLSIETSESPWQVGPRLFYMKRSADQEQPCLVMQEKDREAMLVDPNEDERHLRTVQILQVSSDGRQLAFGEKIGGEDTCRVRFLDVDFRTVLPASLDLGFHRGIAYGRGGAYVYHAHERAEHPSPNYRAVYRLHLASGCEEEVFFAGEGPQLRVRVVPGVDEEWMIYLVRRPDSPNEFYLHNPLEQDQPRLVNDPGGAEFGVIRVGSRCWALTRPPGRPRQIVAFDARRSDPLHWETIVPELPEEMTDCTVWGDSICVTRPYPTEHVTTIYDLNGKEVDKISYPEGGTVNLYTRRCPAQSGIYYRYSTFSSPAVICRYDLVSRTHKTVFTEKVPFLPRNIESRQTEYLSADGTKIPICLAWDPENVLPAPAPLIFTAYGGFGMKLTPAYSTFVTFLLQQGFRFAFANVRGGSELGQQWYEGGRRRNKPNTISDFIAGAEWLIVNGYTSSNKLAIFGGSSAGLLVAAAMTARPDLFRSVLCLATLLDMLRYHRFNLTYRWISEYGSVDDPDDFRVLLSYSPYHAVRTDVVYPSVLFISGEADSRSNPLHIRKMAARMQMVSNERTPVLVDISPTRGHSPTAPLSLRIESLSRRLAFICNELGIQMHDAPPTGID